MQLRTLLITVFCSLATLCAADPSGLTGTYYDNADFSGSHVTRVDAQLAFVCAANASPIPGIAANSFSIEWNARLTAPVTGAVTLISNSDDGVEVWLDRKLVLANWISHGRTRNAGVVQLVAGRSYELLVRYYQNSGPGEVDLRWKYGAMTTEDLIPGSALTATAPTADINLPPGDGTGFTATYFDNEDFTGPTVTANTSSINYLWGNAAPIQGIQVDHWSVSWSGMLQVPVTDTYRLSIDSSGSYQLMLDGKVLIDRTARHTDAAVTGEVTLIAGKSYPFSLRFAKAIQSTKLRLFWSTDRFSPRLLSGSYLYGQPADPTAFDIGYADTRVSPAWLAGSVNRSSPGVFGRVNDAATVKANRDGASRWYLHDGRDQGPLGIALKPGVDTTVEVTDGTTTQRRVLTWAITNLAETYGIDPTTLRVGDALLLTHAGVGAKLEIDTAFDAAKGFRPILTGIPGSAIPYAFAVAGTYLLRARIDGVVMPGGLMVRVVAVDLKGPIACEITYTRIKDVGVSHPALVAFNAPDPYLLSVGVPTAITGGVRLKLSPLASGEPEIQARLVSSTGPIIARCVIDEFLMRTTAERRLPIDVKYTDGSFLGSARLEQTPWVSGLTVKMVCFKAGVLFTNGSTSLIVTTDAFSPKPFSADGTYQFPYQIISAAGLRAGVCHSFGVFQNNVQIAY
jgi:PA14 domain